MSDRDATPDDPRDRPGGIDPADPQGSIDHPNPSDGSSAESSDAGAIDETWAAFARSGGGAAPSEDSRFQPCYRHRERMTGITCQRCSKPICGACMHPASVGFQCPDCVGAAAAAEHEHRRRRGGVPRWLRKIGESGTLALVAVLAVVGVADLITGNLLFAWLGYSGPWIAAGQFWRPLTGTLFSVGAFSLLINLVFLYLIGRNVESVLGRWPLIGVWLASGLGAAAALSLFSPVEYWPLTNAGILGLLAAVMILKHHARIDIRPDLILLGLLVGFSVLMGLFGGSAASWISQLGGIAAGCGAGALLAYPRGRTRVRTQRLGVIGLIVVLWVVAVVGTLI